MAKREDNAAGNGAQTDQYTTDVVHFDRRMANANGTIHSPVHPSVQYTFESVDHLIGAFQGRIKGNSPYARQGTPSTAALEAKLASIEEGVGAVNFATGMAAITAVFLTLLKAGDHLIVSKYLFGNTASLLDTLANFGVEISRVDGTDVQNVIDARQANTRMVFVESVANPGTQVADMVKIGEFCQQEELVYIVDNTILSACLFKPKAVGASMVIHSLTKSAAGQGQALGGVVIDTGLYNWENYPNIFDNYRSGDSKMWGLMQVRKKGLRDMGGTMSSATAHQISLGLETMALRLGKSSETALAVAEFLESHPQVAKVHYPFLKSHPANALATEHFGAGSWLLSFELADADSCLEFVDALQIIMKATGLGDSRSLIIPVAHTIFWEMGPEKRQQMNIGDGMLRLSVGLEDSQNLIADLQQAFESVANA